MIPSVLLAAAFSLPVERTATFRTPSYSIVPVASSGGSAVPWQYAIEVWGDPPHLRGYPWKGRSWSLPVSQLPDSLEDRIQAYESLILDMRSHDASSDLIAQLQRNLDELKKSRKK